MSLLVFVLKMFPLSEILQRRKWGNGKGKFNDLLFVADLKLFPKAVADLDRLIRSVQISSNDIKMQVGF